MELNVDSEVVVGIIKGHTLGATSGYILVISIKTLLRLDREVKIIHVFREANHCADDLANVGCTHELSLVVYEHPPVQLVQALLSDIRRVSTPHLILM